MIFAIATSLHVRGVRVRSCKEAEGAVITVFRVRRVTRLVLLGVDGTSAKNEKYKRGKKH